MPKGIPRDQSLQRTIAHRLKIARGHLDKVIEMVENGKYCIDVINQSAAVQSALKSADELILQNHLETCVSEAIKNGKSKEIIAEVIKVVNKR
jgi:DNA-binding FrmR family transcriptional regulator